MPFGLVRHELASNAVKYGALSVPQGHVTLRWRVEPEAGNESPHLIVEWGERGGPKVTPPEKDGFGSTLIRRSLSGAKVGHQLHPDGVVCTIEQPLPGDTADELGEHGTERT